MRAGAFIVDKGKILLIHRFFQGREYYVIPGGGVEEGETLEEAAIREVKEETNLDAKLKQHIFEFYNEFDKRVNHFFLVTEFSGEPKLGGPEAARNSEEDKYILEWHKLSELNNINLVPKIVQEKLLTLSL
jgi:8-oxo-dGTP pyrophosphatase MutT (NUDIX family)